ncbi:MAG: DUF460 domain-containing protein [Methanomicrobium sp.]|nr:DUF460 domain-containing protein [Methanomicrobium sp.]
MKIFGIDIIGGSVRSRTRKPVFALTVRDAGEIKDTAEVSLYRLIRRINAEQPDILAVDSLQEISQNIQELVAFMQMLPPATKVVLVTRGMHQEPESLQQVAARYNIRLQNKLDPYSESKTIAHVAELGAGSEVIVFDDTCGITVSRNRSLGKGGWSQNRYARKVNGAVLVKSREIESRLKEKGLRFEKTEYAGFCGMKRVHFHVFAGRKQIPVQAGRSMDYQVRIAAGRLDKIRFVSQNTRKKHVIVGIDPGTTVGIAVLDMEGNLLKLKSARRMSLSDWTQEIAETGNPVVVASDVAQMPMSVEKIRRAFNAVPHTPKVSKTQDEKAALCNAYGLSYGNDHERDSLSAALDAYKFYRQKFQTIEKRIPAGYDLDIVRAGIIRGYSPEQIISDLIPSARASANVTASQVAGENGPGGSSVSSISSVSSVFSGSSSSVSDADSLGSASALRTAQLEGMIKDLRNHIDDIRKELKDKEAEIKSLKKQLSAERTERFEKRKENQTIAERDNQIISVKKLLRKQERENRRLQRKIKRLKEFNDFNEDDAAKHIPVKVLSALTKEELKEMDDELGIREGDIIYPVRTDGWGNAAVSYLSDSLVRAVIADSKDMRLMYALRDERIPLIAVSEVFVTVRGRTGTVKREHFEEALTRWTAEQEVYEREKNREMLFSIFREYKNQRVVEARNVEKVRAKNREKQIKKWEDEAEGGDDVL